MECWEIYSSLEEARGCWKLKKGEMSVERKQMHMLENFLEGTKLNRIHGGNSNTKEGIRTGHRSCSSLTLLHIGIALFI